jgi:rpsU-divergently transcribed protein
MSFFIIRNFKLTPWRLNCLTTIRTESSTTTPPINDHNQERREEEEKKQQTPNEIKREILENAMRFVKEHGFSTRALGESAKFLGYSPASKGLFDNGAFDLIDYFYKKSNQQMAHHLEQLIKDGKIVRKNELVKEAIIYRLQLIQPYINHWPDAMALIATSPRYAVRSIENLLRLCDEIWYQLGDKSVDVIEFQFLFFFDFKIN